MVRVVACDDGVVRKLGSGYTVVACVAWDEFLGPLESGLAWVRVDGLDASSAMAYIVFRLSRSVGGVSMVLLDSVTVAGFNLASPATIYRLAGVPVVFVYKYRPSLDRLARAVSNVDLPDVRLRVLGIVGDVVPVSTPRGKLYIVAWGVGVEDAVDAISRLQVYSRVPEPLRLAHYLASSVSRILYPCGGECFYSGNST